MLPFCAGGTMRIDCESERLALVDLEDMLDDDGNLCRLRVRTSTYHLGGWLWGILEYLVDVLKLL